MGIEPLETSARQGSIPSILSANRLRRSRPQRPPCCGVSNERAQPRPAGVGTRLGVLKNRKKGTPACRQLASRCRTAAASVLASSSDAVAGFVAASNGSDASSMLAASRTTEASRGASVISTSVISASVAFWVSPASNRLTPASIGTRVSEVLNVEERSVPDRSELSELCG